MKNKLPWIERVGAISINPDMATRDDIARLAAELIDLQKGIDYYHPNVYREEGRREVFERIENLVKDAGWMVIHPPKKCKYTNKKKWELGVAFQNTASKCDGEGETLQQALEKAEEAIG